MNMKPLRVDLLKDVRVVTNGTECSVWIKCPMCKEEHAVAMRFDEWRGGRSMWERGAYIQDAFPRLSPEDREILISGTCPKCWDKIFGGDLP